MEHTQKSKTVVGKILYCVNALQWTQQNECKIEDSFTASIFFFAFAGMEV
jgi:hypothetical protein